MLLRQYKRVRRELGKKFHYRDIKKVYTIVLFEKSNSVFKSFSKDIYEEIYNICRNSERMMGMFSKELEILDRNTVGKGNTESGERITGGRKGTDPVEGRTGKTEKIDEIHSDISCFLFTLRSWSVIITVKTAGRHLFEDSDNRKR